MITANHIRGLFPWVGAMVVLGFLLLALTPGSNSFAGTATGDARFDHFKTGFPLTGAHAQVPCETCHIQGIFKGTPNKCETCHTPGSRIQTTTFKPNNHIATTQTCDQCHRSTASWSAVIFSHVGVIPQQCAQCHNGSIVTGKPANHIPTSASCDSCHRTTTWISAGFDHIGVMPGTCATCHVPGGSGTAKPANHIPTTLSCDACHATGGTFTTSTFTHSATQGVLPGQCASSGCHSGAYTAWNALSKPANHVATSASCDTCHTGYQSFVTSTFDHTGVVPGTCATCHVPGGSGMAKPANHIPTNVSCDACHATGGT
ncbi:MAG: cytochrome c3 family protein, partial [Sulfuricaulis sp.]